MKNVVVTGATGFIGRGCLSPLLTQGYEVHAVTSRRPQSNLDGLHWHLTDLLDVEQTTRLMQKIRPTHLLHFAWFTVPKEYWVSVENLRWVQASLALLQAFAENGGRRVVMAGTCAEYDWHYGYCSEQTTPLAPTTLYGVCKHSLQSVLAAYARQTGLSAAWGRIFFVYGPHEHPARLVPSVIRSLLRSESARCSHGRQIRDFMYVEDLACAFIALLNSTAAGPINVASGSPIALKDVIDRVATLMGRPQLIQFGALPSPLEDPPLLVANVNRLRDEIGWQPRYNLEQGLRRTIDWWKGAAGGQD